jgi:hypothetical protein
VKFKEKYHEIISSVKDIVITVSKLLTIAMLGKNA